jgi:hypothetical protein
MRQVNINQGRRYVARFTIQIEIGNATAADSLALREHLTRVTDRILKERFKDQGFNAEHVGCPYVGNVRTIRLSD